MALTAAIEEGFIDRAVESSNSCLTGWMWPGSYRGQKGLNNTTARGQVNCTAFLEERARHNGPRRQSDRQALPDDHGHGNQQLLMERNTPRWTRRSRADFVHLYDL